jgi:hypothetical protein
MGAPKHQPRINRAGAAPEREKPRQSGPSIKELVSQRDRAEPGSPEEDKAVDQILKRIFPDTE